MLISIVWFPGIDKRIFNIIETKFLALELKFYQQIWASEFFKVLDLSISTSDFHRGNITVKIKNHVISDWNEIEQNCRNLVWDCLRTMQKINSKVQLFCQPKVLIAINSIYNCWPIWKIIYDYRFMSTMDCHCELIINHVVAFTP